MEPVWVVLGAYARVVVVGVGAPLGFKLGNCNGYGETERDRTCATILNINGLLYELRVSFCANHHSYTHDMSLRRQSYTHKPMMKQKRLTWEFINPQGPWSLLGPSRSGTGSRARYAYTSV